MAVAFTVVASLGLATVPSSAQTGGELCPSGEGTLPYTDVPETHFAFNDIRCLLELEITQTTGSFRPDENVTRAQMAVFMAGTYEAVTGTDADVVETPFTDVPTDHWSARQHCSHLRTWRHHRHRRHNVYARRRCVPRPHRRLPVTLLRGRSKKQCTGANNRIHRHRRSQRRGTNRYRSNLRPRDHNRHFRHGILAKRQRHPSPDGFVHRTHVSAA